MKHFELSGEIRKVGNKAVIKAFRKQGLVPCNLYGAGMENVLFTVSAKDLKPVLYTPASFIIDLKLGDKTFQAVLHELQFHPVGVQAGGKFTQLARKVRVSALVENLPDQLDIDITPLGLDKRLTVGDLKFENINILTDKNTIICRVKTTRAMQQAAAEAAKK